MIRKYIKRAHIYKLVILVLLVAAGIALNLAGMLDPEKILSFARGYTGHWWLAVILVLLQVILFTFGLAGSVFFWVVAPIYSPLVAALILALGGTLGGISAYWFSRRLTDDWIARIENSHAYRLLHQQDNFFTLFAMRVFPAFPHALVNYSSGMLHVRISHFIMAAMLGIFIKAYLYARVVNSATTTASYQDLLNFSTLAPLIALSAISLLAMYIKHRLTMKKPEAKN